MQLGRSDAAPSEAASESSRAGGASARKQFRALNDDVYRASFGAQFFSGLVAPATTFIGNLGYVAVAVVGEEMDALGRHQPFEAALPRFYPTKFVTVAALEEKFREYAAKDFGTTLRQAAE